MIDHAKRTCPMCLMRFKVIHWQATNGKTSTSIRAMRCSEPHCGRRFHGSKFGYVMEAKDLNTMDRLILSNGRWGEDILEELQS